MTRWLAKVLVVSMVFMGFSGQPVWAEGPERRILDKLLERMIQKGILTQQEAEELVSEAEQSVASPKEPLKVAVELPKAKEELEFQFEQPVLDPPSESKPGIGLGPVNLNFGGTFDSRFVAREGKKVDGLMIHINELVMTTNIGDHISFLGEWLLQTDKFIDDAQDDHGFAYAIISDIPYLPISFKDITLKVGRFRARYGIDAELDAPANPIYTQVRRSLGFISDKGFEIDGFWKDVDYSLAVMNGPDFLENEVFDSAGNLMGMVKMDVANNSKPILARVNYDAGKLVKNLDVGLSYFDGRSWPYLSGLGRTIGMKFGVYGGGIDGSQLVYKRRLTPFLKYRVEPLRLNLSGEFTWGTDSLIGPDSATVRGYFLRGDRVIKPNKLDLTLQYSFWDDGRSNTQDGYEVAAGLKFYLTDAVYIRPTAIINNKYDDFYVIQFYAPF